MKDKTSGTVITGCTLTGISWDGKAIEAVNDVAKALLNLTELFSAQNIKIDSLIHIGEKGLTNAK